MGEFTGILIGWGIGCLVALTIFRFVYLPITDRIFARNLYGEDNLCRKKVHSRKNNPDERCFKMMQGQTWKEHCCECEDYLCMFEAMKRNNALWNYKGKKKKLISYLKKNKVQFNEEEIIIK